MEESETTNKTGHDERLERIRAAVDLPALVMRSVPLKRPRGQGDVLIGTCPFCAREEQLNVRPRAFYCFGCGAGGDAIGWAIAKEHCTLGEAVNALEEIMRECKLRKGEPAVSPISYYVEDAQGDRLGEHDNLTEAIDHATEYRRHGTPILVGVKLDCDCGRCHVHVFVQWETDDGRTMFGSNPQWRCVEDALAWAVDLAPQVGGAALGFEVCSKDCAGSGAMRTGRPS